MAYKYRTNRDEKVDLKRVDSSFSDTPELNKARQISRRNDDVKNVNVGIYDIDLAFKDFLEKDVKPTIEENGKYTPTELIRFFDGDFLRNDKLKSSEVRNRILVGIFSTTKCFNKKGTKCFYEVKPLLNNIPNFIII